MCIGLICAAIALATVAQEANPMLDPYGGLLSVRGRKTGHFHVQKLKGVWWLITPDGHGFLSKGVCHASFTGDNAPSLGYAPYGRVTSAKYGSATAWAQTTVERLKSWGLNTVGAWSSPELYTQKIAYAPVLNLAASAKRDLWLSGGFPDVFDPAFVQAVGEVAARECAGRKNDPWVLGYFTDNELRWGPDWRSKESLLETFLAFAEGSPGRLKAEAHLRKRKRQGPPTDDDKDSFLRIVAEQYFRVCRAAIRAADPNHMVLGCRFAGYAPEPVLAGLRRHVDVLSYNDYSLDVPIWKLERLHTATGLPIIITEFSFKAADSGLPNTKGAGFPVKTQQERADRFERFVTSLAKLPYWVGYHWFEWCDEPKEGRFDGENSNYGLVRIDDTPWEVLTARFTEVNTRVEDQHRRGR